MSDETNFSTNEADARTAKIIEGSGVIKSAKDFSGSLTMDLTDEEIARAYAIVVRIKRKWQDRFRTKFNDWTTLNLDEVMDDVAAFEDEVKYEIADKAGVLATVNTVPLIEGKPLEIDWIGKIPTNIDRTEGFDHEKKGWEVKRANARGEDFLGQKDLDL